MHDERQALKFECTGCGQCCTGRGDYFIEATAPEQRRIQRFLGISWRWFRRRYVFRYDEEVDSLRMEKDGRCVFLGPANRCRIYRARPAQCRTYPFWPELVEHATAWQAERRRCEGIGRGQAVPLARVQALLKRQRPS